MENIDSSEVTWADVAATALGAPRKAEQVSVDSAQDDTIEDSEDIEDMTFEPGLPEVRDDDLLRQRARSLMTELQEVIESLSGESSFKSDNLATELEISLTRPTALEGDALVDLRAAAESAQERPRDLDTLTALTAQADAILALIVGYERATAGIERAIEALRRSPGETGA